jgi:hypothetical protein
MFNYTRSKFRPFASTMTQGFLFRQIFAQEYLYFIPVNIPISLYLHSFSYISVSPSLHLPPYYHLLRHLIFLTISISLPFAVKENDSSRGSAPNNSACIPYSERNFLLILQYCAEKYSFKRRRQINLDLPRSETSFEHLPPSRPLCSHSLLPVAEFIDP